MQPQHLCFVDGVVIFSAQMDAFDQISVEVDGSGTAHAVDAGAVTVYLEVVGVCSYSVFRFVFGWGDVGT